MVCYSVTTVAAMQLQPTSMHSTICKESDGYVTTTADGTVVIQFFHEIINDMTHCVSELS